MTQLFIAGLLGGLTGHLIAFSLKSVYYWFSDKYIDIGSPWDDTVRKDTSKKTMR